MTTTVDILARDIIASSNTSAGSPLIVRWLNNRYSELVNRVKFRHLRKIGELSLPAEVTAGTIDATRGSTAITGTSTTFEDEISAGTQTDYYFRTRTAWYKISSITDNTNLVLASAFAEDDVDDGTYSIVKRTHSLNSTARWTGTFLYDRLRYELIDLSLDELNSQAPSRTLAGSPPTHVAQVGVDSSGYLSYEIYPPPSETELIHYIYWDLPTALTFASSLPQVVDSYVLKEGILIDVHNFEKTAQIKLGNIEAAAVHANEAAKQRTIWQKAIKDAIRTSRGADDITFILQMTRGGARRSYDQRTARDYVYDNWTRP